MVVKCRFCGGDVAEASSHCLGICNRCGQISTMPDSPDDNLIARLNRGHYFRRAGEYAKAAAAFSEILSAYPKESEAYWGRALSRYGVLYTCISGKLSAHSHIESKHDLVSDPDYLNAVNYAESSAANQLKAEAALISGQETENSITPTTQEVFRLIRNGDWKIAGECASGLCKAEPDNPKGWLACLMIERHCRKPEELKDCVIPLTESIYYQRALSVAEPGLNATLTKCNDYILARLERERALTYERSSAQLEQADSSEEFRHLYDVFSGLGGYRDSADKAAFCLMKVNNRKSSKAPGTGTPKKIPSKHTSSQNHSFHKVFLISLLSVILISLLASGAWMLNKYWIVPMRTYNSAEAFLDAGDWEAAIRTFEDLSGFKDSAMRAFQIKEEKYSEAESKLSRGELGQSAAIWGGLKNYRDSEARAYELWQQIVSREKITAGGWFTAAIGYEGVLTAGDNRDGQCNITDWDDVVSVSAGWSHIVGRKADGTVISAGYNSDGRSNTASWSNVVDVSAGQWHTVALLSNGSVIGTGCSKDGRLDVSEWKNVIAVSAGRNHTAALLSDGSVAAVGRNEENQCDVSGWSGVTSISAGGEHTLGLLKDGTVIAAGSAIDGACNVQNWSNIVAVSAGYYHSVGLRKDGTVVAAGSNLWGQCDVSDWKDIVAIAAGGWHTIGLRSDGSVICTGRAVNGQCDIAQWTNIG